MANKKSKKIEKETRRLIESISDIITKKDNKYRFKGVKRKEVRRIKRSCFHWRIRKGKEYPAVEEIEPGYWTCQICKKSFKIVPPEPEDCAKACEAFLGLVDLFTFYSVQMGGDSDDTKVFLNLKRDIPRFQKIIRNINKGLNKRKEYENRRQSAADDEQFSEYASMRYRI